MKIVLLGPVHPYRGGIAHFTQNLAENLLQNGYDVLTISYRKQYPKRLYPGKSDKDFNQEIKIKDTRFLFSPILQITSLKLQVESGLQQSQGGNFSNLWKVI